MISAAGFFHHTPSAWMKGPVLSLGHFKRALRDNFWQAPKERAQLALLKEDGIDLIVRARYMQVSRLDSSHFMRYASSTCIICFLPAFMGARPIMRPITGASS
jgi:formyltetrahydrofolate hydrolase